MNEEVTNDRVLHTMLIRPWPGETDETYYTENCSVRLGEGATQSSTFVG